MMSFSRARRRSVSLLAITALLLALALSSCAGRGAARSTTNPGGSGYTSTQTTGNNDALNADISALSTTDAQLQAALASADDAQNAANQDQSALDTDATP